MADPAQAEVQQPQRIVSACRGNGPASAAGKIPDGPPKNREAGRLAASAAPVMFAGGFEKAIERLNQAIELDPDTPHFRLNRGSAYVGNRQFDKAIEDYDRAIALDSSSSLAFLARAEAYLKPSGCFPVTLAPTWSAVRSMRTSAYMTGLSKIWISRSGSIPSAPLVI